MVPVLTTETFSRALWADVIAVHRALPSCQEHKLFVCEGEHWEQGLLCSAPALRPWGTTDRTPGQGLCVQLWCTETHPGLCVCHQIPHQGTFNIFHRLHQLHSEVFMTFSCLPSLLCAPFFMRANSSPLSLSWSLKKKNHFYVICFLYFLFSTCGSCFAGPLLCKSPFTEEDLPVRDWQEVPGAGYETFETRELANQQVSACSSGYAPSISS